MKTIDLAVILSPSAKAANELGFLLVLIDETGTISITHVNVTIRSDGHVGWTIDDRGGLIFGLVSRRLCRIPQGEYFFALQGPLGHDAVLKIAKIEEFFASRF